MPGAAIRPAIGLFSDADLTLLGQLRRGAHVTLPLRISEEGSLVRASVDGGPAGSVRVSLDAGAAGGSSSGGWHRSLSAKRLEAALRAAEELSPHEA